MKKLLFSIFTFLAFANGFAQIINPVKWTSKVEKLSETEFNLVMEGKIEDEWHVYSQFTPADGPIPAEFKFKDAKGNFELIGKTKESPYKKQYNDIFEVDEYYFEKKVTFTQKVKITNPKLTSIKASIDYQVCKEVCKESCEESCQQRRINSNARWQPGINKWQVAKEGRCCSSIHTHHGNTARNFEQGLPWQACDLEHFPKHRHTNMCNQHSYV